MNEAAHGGIPPAFQVSIGLALTLFIAYPLMMSGNFDNATLETMLAISGPRYLTAFLVGFSLARVAACAPIERTRVYELERWIFMAASTLLAVSAVFLHFGWIWALVCLLSMLVLTFTTTRTGLPLFVTNGCTGVAWGISIGALIYLHMSAFNPVVTTQFLTGDLSQVSPWQSLLFLTVAVTLAIGTGTLIERQILSRGQLAILWFLVLTALVGVFPFLISLALLTMRLTRKLPTVNYFLVGWLCLLYEAGGQILLAGYSLPLGLAFPGLFLPLLMAMSVKKENGWRRALNIIAVLVVAVALWLTFLINYVSFGNFVV